MLIVAWRLSAVVAMALMSVAGRLEPEAEAAAPALASVDLFPGGLESRRILVRTVEVRESQRMIGTNRE